MKNLIALLLVTLLAVPMQAQTPIETTATITDITVYTAAAELHYQKEVALEKGKNTVIFTGLTTAIVPNTININCEDPTVNIVTVTDKINYIKHQKNHSERVSEIHDSINAITERLGWVDVKIEALSAEKELLFKNGSIGGVEKGVPVAEIEKASAFFQKRYFELASELYALSKEKIEMNNRTKKLNQQITQVTSTTSKSTSEIIIVVNAPSRKKVTFSFKLLTDQGGWSPVYDFKYAGADKPLDFIFRANVFNSCGIDWSNVNLKLSTADPIHGFGAPSLGANNNSNPAKPINSNGQHVDFKQIRVSNVIAEYKINNKYSIPSDAKPYLIEVDAYAIPSDFSYLVIPKLDPFGFLMAEIPDWNKYNLIPGTTNIYNKGTYMGKTFLDTYATNDTLSVYLGKDQSIQATRTEKNIHHANNFVGNYAVDKTVIEINIKNNGTSKLKIKVMDHVPVVDNSDKVKLNLMEISNALHDEKNGMLTWHFNIERGEEIPLSIKYELKAPKEFRDKLKSKTHYYRTISAPKF